jgi:steroid 5-alpha reductase family enzyme
MQHSLWILGLGWLAAALAMTALWLYQQARKNATIVDVAWSAGVGLMALAFAYFGEGSTLSRALLAAIAGTWSLRLFLYLLVSRVLKHEEEDGRYAELRTQWGSRASLNFFLFFQFQAFLVVLFAIPFAVVASNPATHWSPWTFTAVALAVTAIIGEAIADAQLAAWRKDPAHRGKTCRAGLWAYSRHPNYFFEWIHWWAYVCLAIGSEMPWLALWGPLIMLLFLFRITGIPYTERQALRSRADYAEYQRSVSVFLPWFPKK